MGELQAGQPWRSELGIGPQQRVASIDILRALTMLVMIFVNDLAGVKRLPWWTHHMPGNANGMTYVDMVFPFFLFLVGMSMPLAVERRMRKGSTEAEMWRHVLARTAALLVLGIALANVEKGDPHRMGISTDAWGALMLLGAVLFWNVYPRGGNRKWLWRGMRAAGLVTMIVLFAIFRRTTRGGDVRWLAFGYWEILGLIGFTYFAVSVLYLPTRRWRWAPAAWLVLLIALNIGATAGWISFPNELPIWLWPWSNGAFGVLTMAGVVCTLWSMKGGEGREGARAARVIGFGLALLLAGWAVRPLGLSKIRATPSWALYCAGSATILFWMVHWVSDVRGKQGWAKWTKAAGENTLLTYLLPDIFYFAVGTRWLPAATQSGAAGVVKALVFTGCMLLFATVLTKWRVRLAL